MATLSGVPGTSLPPSAPTPAPSPASPPVLSGTTAPVATLSAPAASPSAPPLSVSAPVSPSVPAASPSSPLPSTLPSTLPGVTTNAPISTVPSPSAPASIPAPTTTNTGAGVVTVVATTTSASATPTLPPVPQNGATSNSKSFFSNTGAVAATFTVVGLVVLAFAAAIVWSLIRRSRSMKFDREVAAAAAAASLQTSRRPMEEDRYDYPGGYSNQSHSGYGQQSPMASYYDPRRYSDATPGMAGIGARRSYAPYPDQYEQRVRQSYTQSGPEPYGAPDGGYGPPARASGHYHSQDPYASQPPRATQYLDSPYSHAYQPAVPENTSRSQLSYGSHITPSSQPTNSEEAYRSDRALSPEATGAIRSRMSGPTVGGEGRRESDAGLDGAYELRRREILKVANQ